MKKSILILMTIATTVMSGCASFENVYPVSSVSTPMERSDYCILDNVRGISETESYFFGLFQVIRNKAVTTGGNADNVVMENQYSSFFWIPEEPDRYSYVKPKKSFLDFSNTEDRAYFNALSVLPEEADSVIGKSYYKEIIRRIPVFYKHEVVEFKGKAIRLKSDRDLHDNVSCINITANS